MIAQDIHAGRNTANVIGEFAKGVAAKLDRHAVSFYCLCEELRRVDGSTQSRGNWGWLWQWQSIGNAAGPAGAGLVPRKLLVWLSRLLGSSGLAPGRRRPRCMVVTTSE